MNYEVIWKIKGLENDKAEKYNPNHSTSTSINPDEFQTVWKNFVISEAAAAKPAMKLKEFLEFLWNSTQFYATIATILEDNHAVEEFNFNLVIILEKG